MIHPTKRLFPRIPVAEGVQQTAVQLHKKKTKHSWKDYWMVLNMLMENC
jgi:hypothetical protein